jgi:hypothetical protein
LETDLHSFGYILRSGIPGSYGISSLNFEGPPRYSVVVVLIYIPTNILKSSLIFVLCVLDDSYSKRIEVESQHGFNFAFPLWLGMGSIASCGFWQIDFLL